MRELGVMSPPKKKKKKKKKITEQNQGPSTPVKYDQ
jgi:hypothetical protein